MTSAINTLKIYPVENYTFGTKEPTQMDQSNFLNPSLPTYPQTRLCTDCILLTYKHNHPHVILLQTTPTFFKLPGGEGDVMAVMSECLVPPGVVVDFEHELLGRWFKHSVESIYPYLPPQMRSPREERRLELVKLPDHFVFAVPKNMKCIAVPLFELYENQSRYGPVISNIPYLLSRFHFDYGDQQQSTVY